MSDREIWAVERIELDQRGAQWRILSAHLTKKEALLVKKANGRRTGIVHHRVTRYVPAEEGK